VRTDANPKGPVLRIDLGNLNDEDGARFLPRPAGVDLLHLPPSSSFSAAFVRSSTENKIGIFGRLVKLETRLSDGDRVEIYRPITADP
jgi:hypothetical protein